MGTISRPQECSVNKMSWDLIRVKAPWVVGVLLILGTSINLGCTPGEGTFLPLSTVGKYSPPPSQETAKHNILEMEYERSLLQGDPLSTSKVIEDQNLEQ